MSLQQYNVYDGLTAVRVANTINLAGTYFNGVTNNGVGSTLTTASGSLTIDGVVLSNGDRVLLQAQTSAFQNGIYVVSGVNSAAVVLTRSADFQNIEQMKTGQFVSVAAGTAEAGAIYVMVEPFPAQIGISSIIFNFVGVPAGDGFFLQTANNLSDVANVSTSRTNLGLGTAATKAASDNTKASVASVSGGTVLGTVATFADNAGTVIQSTSAFRAQTASNGGGSATVTITDANITSSSIMFAQIKSSANAVSIQKVTPGSGSAIVLCSGDPGVSVFSYIVVIPQ